MKEYYSDSLVTILHGDCREFEGTADVILTDPPYGLEFMGKGWDKGVPTFWHFNAGWLFAFGGTRTWHRLACAIEDAGWQIRDTMMWLYGQGFPKGKNNLKPAWEPVIVARKYGDFDIEGARIGVADTRKASHTSFGRISDDNWQPHDFVSGSAQGRWPANLLLECTCDEVVEGTCNDGKAVRHNSGGNTFGTDRPKPPMPDMQYGGKCVIHTDPNCPCRMLDEQSGESASNDPGVTHTTADGWGMCAERRNHGYAGDTGGASRFFYVAKASRSERGDGNDHPTVKPLKLMEYLVKLSGGQTILDPFMGSGTTLVAAKRLGRKAIGIDIDEHSCEIAAKRCGAVLV